MKRFAKILTIAGMSSVYLMQVPCTTTGGGLSILPNIGLTALLNPLRFFGV